MRFAVSDSSDEDGYASAFSFISDESDRDEDRPVIPRSTLGKTIRAYVESSESESEVGMDSEDEVELLGMGDGAGGRGGGGSNGGWDSKSSQSWRQVKAETIRLTVKAESSKAPWRRKMARRIKEHRSVSSDQPSPYEGWLKSTEQQAIHDGHRLAHQRRGELREITSNARSELQRREDARLAKDEEDMTRLLEAIAIRQHRDEQEVETKFAEREQRLWADIDAAIAEVEKREAELKAATLAAMRKKQEEEAARTAAAEKEASARRAEAEKLAREHAERERMAKEKAADEAKRSAEEKEAAAEANEKAAEQEKKAAEKGKVGSEWRSWVEKQRWMKKEVIEPVKSDRALRTSLRQGMRLITRGLGQVVNTKESIVRVTIDIHKLLCDQLPSEPSPAQPTLLSQPPPKPYCYLSSHLSKALVKQATEEVSAKPDAAFPLGRVVTGLLLRGHAAFGDILFARLVKKCPWVIPFYPSRQNNQPREEYEKSTGRGVDESLSDYIARMTGIITLYLSIIQTPLTTLLLTLPAAPTPDQLATLLPPPLRFPAAWAWLSNALRDPLPALPPIASMVTAWIEILGAESIRLYGRGQMGKVFEAIQSQGVQGGKIKADGEASRAKLGLVLEKWTSLSLPAGREWE